MKNEYVLLPNFELYIRFPEKIGASEDAVIHIKIPPQLAGKSLKISVPSGKMPFSHCEIQSTDYRTKVAVDYYGYDFYWDPLRKSYKVVKNNPICKASECPECGSHAECLNVACSVYQGMASSDTEEVPFVLSKRLMDNDY